MKKLFLALVAIAPLCAQISTINPTDTVVGTSLPQINANFSYLNGKILNGIGAPVSNACNSASVGTIYMRTDAAAQFGTMYVCGKTGGSTYTWEGPYAASATQSVFGRTGNVVAQTGDYTAAQVGALSIINNLSDLSNPGTARSNLGLGSSATQSASTFAQTANNLSDLQSASAARTNLGLGSSATLPSSTFLQSANSLSDVGNAATARTNLGLGTAATASASTFLQGSNNLSDLNNATTARTNLGLGSAAVQSSSSFLADPGANGIVKRTSAGSTGLAIGADLPSGYPYSSLTGAPSTSTTVNGTTCTLGSTCSPSAAPSGAATGDLNGSYPNPTVTSTHLLAPLPVAQGGTGTATPGIVAGTNVTVSGTWPNQTVASSVPASLPGTTSVNGTAIPASSTLMTTTSSVASGQMPALTGDATSSSGSTLTTVSATHLAAPLPVAQGGTGTSTPGLVAGSNVTITGTWPNQTIASAAGGGTNYQTFQHDGTAVTQRQKFNLAAGANVSITATDNGTDTTTFTVTSSGGGTNTPGGSTNAVQYNTGSAFGGILNATATNKFLTQSSSAAPAWNTLAASDIPTALSSTTSVNGTTIPSSATLMTTSTGVTGSQLPALTGDTTMTAGTTVTTTGKVNGVAYPGGPSTNTVPVVTALNTVTYEAVPNSALANSSVTINGSAVSLGGSGTITAAPSGSAGGDLSSTYPNPTVKGINGVALSGLATGILKNTTTTGVPSIAGSSDVIALFSGCSGSQYLGADGACHSASGAGTVTSVGMTVPSVLSVTGSPVTTSGTLALSFASGQTANQFLATPNGASGALGLRSIVAADLPTITLSGDVTGNTGAATVGKINGVSLAGLSTGLLKNTTTTGAPSIATSSDIIGLFTACSGTQYLGADGACHTPAGGGTVSTSGSPATGNLTKFSGANTITNGDLSGDVTTSGTLAATVKGINGTLLSGLSTGLLKNTTTTGVPSIAVVGSDYAPATSGSSMLKGNGAGGFSNAVAGTDYSAAMPSTLNLLKGNNSGGALDSGIAASTVMTSTNPPLVISQATTFYVCPSSFTNCAFNGDGGQSSTPSDSNTLAQAQSKATPWATLAHAASILNGAILKSPVTIQFADTAVTSVSVSQTSGSTTLSLSGAASIANGDILEVEGELEQVTAGGGTTTLTVVRGYGTTVGGQSIVTYAAAHNAGVGVTRLVTGFVYQPNNETFQSQTMGSGTSDIFTFGQTNITDSYPQSYIEFKGNISAPWNVIATGASPVNSPAPGVATAIRCLNTNCVFHGLSANYFEYLNTQAGTTPTWRAFTATLKCVGGAAACYVDNDNILNEGGQGATLFGVDNQAFGYLGPNLTAIDAGIFYTNFQAEGFSHSPAGYETDSLTVGANASGSGTKNVFVFYANESGHYTRWGPTSITSSNLTGSTFLYGGIGTGELDNAQNNKFPVNGSSNSTVTLSNAGGLTYAVLFQGAMLYDSCGATGNTCSITGSIKQMATVNTGGIAIFAQSFTATNANTVVNGGKLIIGPFNSAGSTQGVDVWADRYFRGYTSPCAMITPGSGDGQLCYDATNNGFRVENGSSTKAWLNSSDAALASGQLVIGAGNGKTQTADLSGDISTSGSTSTTLATVNSGPGSCGDSTHVCQVTTDGKGRVTAQSQVAISGGGAGGAANVTCSVTAPSTTCTHSLNTLTPVLACFDGSGNWVSPAGQALTVNTFLVTSSVNLSCAFNNGGNGALPAGSTNSIQYKASSSTFGGPSLPTSPYPETITQVGSAAPSMMQGMYGYGANVLMPNAKFISIKTGHAAATDVDLYTPPSNRVACFAQMQAYNDSGSSVTWYPEVKISSTYYELTSSSSVSANASTNLTTGICFGSTVTLSTHQATTSVINVTANLIEFDSTSSFIPIVIPITSATTGLYTVSTGHSAALLQGGFFVSGAAVHYSQDSTGASRTVKLYQTSAAVGSQTSSDLLDSRSVSVSTRQDMTAVTSAGAGESWVVTVDSTAGHQIVYGAIVDVTNAQ